jgi:hypothetical protein
MHAIRLRLRVAALTVVLCHVAGMASAVMRQTAAAESPAGDRLVCTCTNGPHTAECPMHKAARATAAAPSSTDCRFRCCRHETTEALTSAYWAGPLVSRVELPAPASSSTSRYSIAMCVLDARRTPDPPPPRA